MASPLSLDKNAILDNLGGDEDLFAEMARMFIEESSTYRQNLLTALTSGNPQAVRGEAHTLKSLLATFADKEGHALAASIELQAKNGEINTDKISQLEARITDMAKILGHALN